jgi:hypothetical protein
MNQNEKKSENTVVPFGISMLAAQKSPRLKTNVSAGGSFGGGRITSDDIRANVDGGGLSNLT